MVVGEQSRRYPNSEHFIDAVLAAPLRLTGATPAGFNEVSFAFGGHRYHFFPNNITGQYRLPTLDGKAVQPDPPFAYSGPHLNAAFNATVIHAQYESYALRYDFGANQIIHDRA